MEEKISVSFVVYSEVETMTRFFKLAKEKGMKANELFADMLALYDGDILPSKKAQEENFALIKNIIGDRSEIGYDEAVKRVNEFFKKCGSHSSLQRALACVYKAQNDGLIKVEKNIISIIG